MTATVELFTVRHSQTTVRGLCYGRSEVPVEMAADVAARQVLASPLLVPFLPGIPVVYCSPAERCRWLAESIAQELQVECRVDPQIAELDFGVWESRSYDEIHLEDGARFAHWATDPMRNAPPGGETGNALVRRILQWLKSTAGHAIVVTHAGPIRVLRAIHADADRTVGGATALTLDFQQPVVPLAVERLRFSFPLGEFEASLSDADTEARSSPPGFAPIR